VFRPPFLTTLTVAWDDLPRANFPPCLSFATQLQLRERLIRCAHRLIDGFSSNSLAESSPFCVLVKRNQHSSNAFDDLRQSVARTKSERMEAAHPAFGKMNHDEWTKLHLRHAEMHLSFAIPE